MDVCSVSSINLPDWLEDCRIDDDLSAEAYASISSQQRSLLKTAIALADFHYQRGQKNEIREAFSLNGGFWQSTFASPAALAILLINSQYQAAARICAAAITPVLAGVRQVAAISLSAAPSKECLLALELCGVQDIYVLLPKQLDHLLTELALAAQNDIRIINLLDEENPWPNQGWIHGIASFMETGKPALLLKNPELFNMDNLIFAQGFAPEETNISNPDAVYCSLAEARNWNTSYPPLILTPGLECFWLFPGLNVEFFLKTSKAFSIS